MFEVTSILDGVKFVVKKAPNGDIILSIDDHEPVHLAESNALLFASAIFAATEDEDA